jgi:hypothetical protein
VAERITHFSPRRVGRPALYPWDEWMDGSAWRITRSVDFEITPKSMATTLYAHAARQGRSVKVLIDGDAVEFQFAAQKAAA